eukprot:974003-Pleurochrysis_carterae.AAC.1
MGEHNLLLSAAWWRQLGDCKSSGSEAEQQPGPEAATPRPAADRIQPVEIPGGLHTGRGEGSGQGKEA